MCRFLSGNSITERLCIVNRPRRPGAGGAVHRVHHEPALTAPQTLSWNYPHFGGSTPMGVPWLRLNNIYCIPIDSFPDLGHSDLLVVTIYGYQSCHNKQATDEAVAPGSSSSVSQSGSKLDDTIMTLVTSATSPLNPHIGLSSTLDYLPPVFNQPTSQALPLLPYIATTNARVTLLFQI